MDANEKIFLEKFFSLKRDIAEAQEFMIENLGIDTVFDEDTNTLYVWKDKNVNETKTNYQPLTAAKNFLTDTGFYNTNFINIEYTEYK